MRHERRIGDLEMTPRPAAPDPTRSSDALLTELYLAHAAGLNRWMTAYTHDEELAADVVQEAFLRLAGELRAGRHPDNAAAWLAQVSRNLATSRARRAATAHRYAPLLEPPPSPEDPAAVAVATERADAVRLALAGLRPVDRAALVMAAEGSRNAEIAERIGRTELATRALLCRARRRLRPVLAGAGIA
jgi:RNA polymerase sigma factor (sigma-70 family)